MTFYRLNLIFTKKWVDMDTTSGTYENKPTRKELLDMLDEMIKSTEALPPFALGAPISHYDHLALMQLISYIIHLDDDTKEVHDGSS